MGETLGLVGESGCGKSTTGRALVQVQPPTSGVVAYRGKNLSSLSTKELRQTRTKIQMIFQDPISSLNPRRRVQGHRGRAPGHLEARQQAGAGSQSREMLEAVGIDPDAAGDRRPGEFSGGQCQRISIARALMADPDLLICDEPVSALDVSVQAQILNLMADLKVRFGLTMVFIAHDLGVVKNVSDRVAVMYLGKLVEIAPSDDLYRFAAHPYTEALLASIPEPDPDLRTDHKGLSGELPSPLNPPSGCRFRTRCPYAQERCAEQEPLLREIAPGHQVACHFPLVEPLSRSLRPTAARTERGDPGTTDPESAVQRPGEPEPRRTSSPWTGPSLSAGQPAGPGEHERTCRPDLGYAPSPGSAATSTGAAATAGRPAPTGADRGAGRREPRPRCGLGRRLDSCGALSATGASTPAGASVPPRRFRARPRSRPTPPVPPSRG